LKERKRTDRKNKVFSRNSCLAYPKPMILIGRFKPPISLPNGEKMKTMSREAFLNRKKIGLILRVYATDEADIPKRIKMTTEFINRALGVVVDNHNPIRRIDVLVWADPHYKSDCCQTASALNKAFKTLNDKRVVVSEVKHGDLFCGLLNYGIALQSRDGVDYSIIASTEAYSYFTPETITAMIDAACNNARAIGVAINELTQSILEGRICNTFAMWHNLSLLTVGGFDLRAAKPSDERSAHYMRGWHKDKGDVFYHLAGVEEVIPLARLIDTLGPCIVPILPQGEGVQEYIVPDPVAERELWERHISKMGTKIERQTALLTSIGFDLSFLKGGIMEEYRQ